MDKFAGYNSDQLEEARKKAVSHCLNLECKKEQLHILIEKLNSITGHREDLYFKNQAIRGGAPFGLRKSSISDEIKFAEQSQEVIDIEIKNAKYQLKIIEKILSNK